MEKTRIRRTFPRGLLAAFLLSLLLVFTTGMPSGGSAGAGGGRRSFGTVNGGRLLTAQRARAKARRLVHQQMRGLRNGGRVHVRLNIVRRYAFWGDATTYSEATNGSGTACGVPFNDNNLTAAHRSLPCGSKVQVENPQNGNRVNVTITDRGPFGDSSRVIDLSPAAWRRLTNSPPGVMHIHAIVLRRG